VRITSRLRAKPAQGELLIAPEAWSLALADQLEDRLYDFNVRATGIDDGRGLALVARDSGGRVVAAALGSTWGGVCELKQVWVDEPLRGTGLGRRLIERAIAEAESRGCSQLLLATHAFQAPGFYRKLGFRELHRLEDYPRGHAEIWMVRDLGRRGP
jgi:GNAT superfamily N-acetyltransferase